MKLRKYKKTMRALNIIEQIHINEALRLKNVDTKNKIHKSMV